jgi:hypothetical protein
MTSKKIMPPTGVSLAGDVEFREGRDQPYRARVRWIDPSTKKRPSKSEQFATEDEAWAWIEDMKRAAAAGIDPTVATMTLTDYGTTNMPLALRGVGREDQGPQHGRMA